MPIMGIGTGGYGIAREVGEREIEREEGGKQKRKRRKEYKEKMGGGGGETLHVNMR